MPIDTHRAQRGLTLLELVMAIAIGALLLALGGGSAMQLRDRIAVRTAALRLADAFAAARATALAQDAVTLLVITPRLAQVRRLGDTLDAARVPLEEITLLEGAPRTHRFAPDGLMLDAGNATYELQRGSARRRVVVAKYGRVRIE